MYMIVHKQYSDCLRREWLVMLSGVRRGPSVVRIHRCLTPSDSPLSLGTRSYVAGLPRFRRVTWWQWRAVKRKLVTTTTGRGLASRTHRPGPRIPLSVSVCRPRRHGAAWMTRRTSSPGWLHDGRNCSSFVAYNCFVSAFVWLHPAIERRLSFTEYTLPSTPISTASSFPDQRLLVIILACSDVLCCVNGCSEVNGLTAYTEATARWPFKTNKSTIYTRRCWPIKLCNEFPNAIGSLKHKRKDQQEMPDPYLRT